MIVFPISSYPLPNSPFLIHNSTIIREYKVMVPLSTSTHLDTEFLLSEISFEHWLYPASS